MARISDLDRFNRRRDIIQLRLDEENTIIAEKNEIKTMLLNFIEEDDLFFANGLTKETKEAIGNRIDSRLISIEKSLQRDLDDKFDSLAQKIVETSTSRVIEEEVARRVNEKLEKLKKLL